MLKVFIGWDSRFPECADVLRYSLQKHSSIPLDVCSLKNSEINLRRSPDPLQTSETAYSRFLVPHLCGFRGMALFLDSRMLCLGDVREIAEMTMSDCWLRVVKNDRPAGAIATVDDPFQPSAPLPSEPRLHWSSAMLLNCSRLTLWTKQMIETANLGALNRFEGIGPALIGELPGAWRMRDGRDERTRLIHYAGSSPWLDGRGDGELDALWLRSRDEMRAGKGRQAVAPRAPVAAGSMPLPHFMPAAH